MAKQFKDAGSVACYARERPKTQKCAAPRYLTRQFRTIVVLILFPPVNL